MQVSVEICVVPMGTDASVSRYVAECQQVLEAAGLEPQMHAYGTNVEGEWDTVFAATKPSTRRAHRVYSPLSRWGPAPTSSRVSRKRSRRSTGFAINNS